MHDCFPRELREGSRPVHVDPKVVVSPCDAIVGASELVDRYSDGLYVTLHLTAGMHHRFHAPHDCSIEQVTYISGDTWNVNPIVLQHIEKLFCKNGRAIV
jgi:phosphatidylserine decarboxylase